MYEIVFDVLFQLGLTLGAGGATFALIFYVKSMQDGTVDAIERSFLRIVFTVLRIGTIFFVGALLLGVVVSGSEHFFAYRYAWILSTIILLNALLTSYQYVPREIGPVLAGATWYALLLVTLLPTAPLGVLAHVVGYAGLVALFAIVFTYLKHHTRTRAAIDSVEHRKDIKTLDRYATDASVFRIVPAKVFYPRTVAEVSTVIRTCREAREKGESVSVSVRAGGTCMSGGSLTNGWILDMTTYMHGVEIDHVNQTATVEGGAYFRDVEDAAKVFNLMFPAYPSSHRLCGIGGMIGNNASGEKSLRYGATGDNILELEVVLSDGTVERFYPRHADELQSARDQELLLLNKNHGKDMKRAVGDVPKAASGYRIDKIFDSKTKIADLTHLFSGAQGTLGVITKAVIKLVPIPRHTALVMISAPSLDQLPDVIDTVFKHNPECVETFDINTFLRAEAYLKEDADRVLPYIDIHAGLFILAEFSEDTKRDTDARGEACADALISSGYHAMRVVPEADVRSAWQVRRNSFTLMRDHNPKGHAAVPCIEDVIVPRKSLGTFITELDILLKKHAVEYGFHGHIGEGSLRIIPVFDFGKATIHDDICALMDDVFALVKELRGNMSADHSDGIIRTPFLEAFYGEELTNAFRRVKELFDPCTVFNPGKKVGGTREDISRYLDR
jgi:FAD/FMN-containing dehydrogenase